MKNKFNYKISGGIKLFFVILCVTPVILNAGYLNYLHNKSRECTRNRYIIADIERKHYRMFRKYQFDMYKLFAETDLEDSNQTSLLCPCGGTYSIIEYKGDIIINCSTHKMPYVSKGRK